MRFGNVGGRVRDRTRPQNFLARLRRARDFFAIPDTESGIPTTEIADPPYPHHPQGGFYLGGEGGRGSCFLTTPKVALFHVSAENPTLWPRCDLFDGVQKCGACASDNDNEEGGACCSRLGGEGVLKFY